MGLICQTLLVKYLIKSAEYYPKQKQQLPLSRVVPGQSRNIPVQKRAVAMNPNQKILELQPEFLFWEGGKEGIIYMQNIWR